MSAGKGGAALALHRPPPRPRGPPAPPTPRYPLEPAPTLPSRPPCRYAQRVTLQERVDAGEREAFEPNPRVDRTAGRQIAHHGKATGTCGALERRGIHMQHGVAERQRRWMLKEPHASRHQHRERIDD